MVNVSANRECTVDASAHRQRMFSSKKHTLGKKKERVEEKAMGTVVGGGGVMGEPLATNGYFSHYLLPGHQSPLSCLYP